MRVEHAASTDVGQMRENNEDSWAVDADIGLFLVADGMGGHARGEVASRMAADIVLEETRKTGKLPGKYDLVQAIAQANRAVHAKSIAEPDHHGMGTTVVAVLTLEGRVAVAHVGDSRGYLYRKGELKQLTRDHTLVQQQIDEGKLRAEDAERVFYKNVLVRAVGTQEEIEVESQLLRIKEDDVLLLCTDGLTAMLTDAEIRGILEKEEQDLKKTCGKLIEEANLAGGKDNVTVILLRFKDVHSALEGLIDRIV